MDLPHFDRVADFASRGRFAQEIILAKAEYIEQTGDILESDLAFEHRMAGFVEWYILDRKTSFAVNATPAKLYLESQAPALTTPELNMLRPLTRTHLTLFEVGKHKREILRVRDLLTDKKHDIAISRMPTGLEPTDIIQSRMFPCDNVHYMSEVITALPRLTRKLILKASKKFRVEHQADEQRITFVHRVAYCNNRSDRYRHLDPRELFKEIAS